MMMNILTYFIEKKEFFSIYCNIFFAVRHLNADDYDNNPKACPGTIMQNSHKNGHRTLKALAGSHHHKISLPWCGRVMMEAILTVLFM